MKFNKEYTLGALLILIVIMVLKPNMLGFLYNNILGKLVFVAAVVFISLKHTAAGLLAVVFVALIASMSGHVGFEGMDGSATGVSSDVSSGVSSGEKKADKTPVREGAENEKKEVSASEITDAIKKATGS
jgi:hypothetical protein